MSLQNEVGAINADKNYNDKKLAAELHDAHRIDHSILINKTPTEVFSFWRNFNNLPLFMKDLASIEILSPTLSRWTVELENTAQAKWNAELIAEIPNEMISWQSVGDSEVNQAGSVWFTKSPDGTGCVVRIQLAYTIPGGVIGRIGTWLMQEDPETLVEINLQRLKSLLETGTVNSEN